jgi:hypothetical protein
MADARTEDQILDWVREEYAYPFAGWDFSHLQDRCDEYGELPFDYDGECVSRIRKSRHVVDIGTGDGVRFAAFLREAGIPRPAAATEGYPPNQVLARTNLEPLGVQAVDGCGTEPLPSGSADLILARHAGFDPPDTFRVLEAGGTWVTEQVGDQTNLEIHQALDAPINPTVGYNSLQTARAQVGAAGFEIERAEEGLTGGRYHDVGILAWYLKAISWEIPDFTVNAYAEQLLRLHRRIEREGPLDVRFHTILIVAHRPL